MPKNTVYVGRPTRWGNPFFVGPAEKRVQLYERWITTQMPALLSEARKVLRGKNLACWCGPGEPCHADVLLWLANEAQEREA